MQNTINTYWKYRIEQCGKALAKNNFEVFFAHDCHNARTIFFNNIFPALDVRSVSWGDSLTFQATGILDELRNRAGLSIIETFDDGVSREEIIERRRQALLADLFFTGSNGVTESGKLVNLDMVGNRVGAITFGPRHVVLFITRNKIVTDLDQARLRIKTFAAPVNAIRHTGIKTPCVKTSYCHDCSSPDRICNTWVITEKSYPKARIKVILINQDGGL